MVGDVFVAAEVEPNIGVVRVLGLLVGLLVGLDEKGWLPPTPSLLPAFGSARSQSDPFFSKGSSHDATDLAGLE